VTLHPEKRFYQTGGNTMTEADMDAGLFRDLYIALGEPVGDNAWAVRVQYKPFVRWVWFGGLLIAMGGVTTLLDRRYRRARRKVAAGVNEMGLAV
jgi:cytochrome c-type biogenesis protein CcmF